ncbi:MAG TPA: bifunctional ornithine acetyltransferase/N-acetylglutamate synthase [Candidatus Limnocylindrales bacterium]|nr:bifunctional ornithine acetyltransferase/N-acetylglutamate synthase [Candidatus Limnocylindrales bacterium]
MTLDVDVLAPLVPALPAVERRARIPAGFVAGGRAAGIKASGRPDLALVAVEPGAPPASAAAVFTPNAFAAAPVRRSRSLLAASGGWARAVVCTSGCANAATGAAGDADQARVGELVAGALGIAEAEILHLSTGIIGTRLPLDRIAAGLDALAPSLAATDEGLESAAVALRTTDSTTKVATVALELPDENGTARAVRVSGMAKGVGMIHPRMATLLAVLVTDAAASPELLASILRPAAARTWDQLSVDGDTSTNDTVFLLASGASGAAPVVAGTPAAAALAAAVEAGARDLARQQAADGEGATCLLTCQVTGALDDAEARAVARAVISSSLVKAAAHGKDPNWGRIAGAAGNARLAETAVLAAAGLDPEAAFRRGAAPASVDPDRLRIAIAGHLVFDGSRGGPQPFDRAAARAAMDGPEIVLRLDLGLGDGTGEAFGCDLTEQYVIENSEYTT